MTLTVFNRWGSVVYENRGTYIPWDGTRNNEEMPVATYYWVINPGDGSDEMQGSVTIMR